MTEESTAARTVDAVLPSLRRTWRQLGLWRLRRSLLQDLPALSGSFALVIGSLIAVGWWLGVDPLRRFGIHVTPLAADTAVALALVGAGMLTLSRPAASGRRRLASLPLMLLLALAVVGVIRMVANTDETTWTWLVTVLPITPAFAGGVGMPPTVLACCLLVATALLLMEWRPMARPTSMLLIASLALSCLSILDLLLDDGVMTLFGASMRVAPGPAAATALLSVGAMARMGSEGTLRVFLGPSQTARFARRLLVASLVVPVLLAWLRHQGEAYGLYAAGFGTSLMVLGTFALLAIAIWQTARVAERTEAARQKALDELDRFFDVSVDMLATVDSDGRLLRINPAWSATLGYPRSELVGHRVTEFIHPDDLAPTLEAMSRRFSERGTAHGFQNRYRHQDGSYRWLEWNTAPSADGLLAYTTARDITARRREEELLVGQRERLRQRNQGLAVRVAHDPLTGLRNRAWFDRAFEAIITRRLRRSDGTTPTSAVMFDLDRFGALNKQYGHQVGDSILRHFADLLRERVRSSDLTARFGGEEFVVVLLDCTREDAARAADAIRVALESFTLEHEGMTVRATVSAGCAELEPGMTPSDLLARADLALSMAKRASRNTVVVA